MRSLRHMSPRVRICVWLILICCAVRWVENYSRRPIWTCELRSARETMLVGWINDNQFALVSGEWDRKESAQVWNRLAIYDQSSGRIVSEYELPDWKYGRFRVQGDRIVLDSPNDRVRPYFDLVTRQFGQNSHDDYHEELSPSGRWQVRSAGYGRWQVRSGEEPWKFWPTEEQLTSWGMIQHSYEGPQDRLIVYFWGLKFSPDETRIATICEQRKPEKTYGDWVCRIHAWPSGEILHEWPLSKNHGNNRFAILPHAWEGDTFFVEEEMDTIGDGNRDDTINRWFRCQVRPTGVEMSVLEWTDWKDSEIDKVRYRWLEASDGECLETYYYSKRNMYFPSWGWRYRFTRWIYDNFNPSLADYSPLLRDTSTGQVLWQGPKHGSGRWSISRDRRFALHLPVLFPQPNDRQTIALYPLVPRPRWPWYAALGLIAVWSWRRFDRKIDSQPAGVA